MSVIDLPIQVLLFMTLYFVTETLSVMAVQVLWILLTSIEVVHLEQPVFVPSAAELSDASPENKQEWLHSVIFEPQNKIQLTRFHVSSHIFQFHTLYEWFK